MSEEQQDSIAFRCEACGTTLGIDESNPPGDGDMYSCNGCGREIGKFGDVKAAMIQAAKDELDKIVSDAFGKPIKLDWKSAG